MKNVKLTKGDMRDQDGRQEWETWETKMGDRSGKTSGRHGRHGWEIEVGDI